MKILIQQSNTHVFNPKLQLVQSPISTLPFLPSLSTPGLVAAEFSGSHGAVTAVGNVRGFAIVAKINGVMTYVASSILSVSIIDPTRNIPPITYATPWEKPPGLTSNSIPAVLAAEGFNSLAPDQFVSLSGDVTRSAAFTVAGKDFGIGITTIASPLQTLKTSQFIAGVIGASTWTSWQKTGAAPIYTNARVTGSIAYALEIQLPTDASGVPYPCYLVKGEQSVESIPAGPAAPVPNYGTFAIRGATTAHYWRLDDPAAVFPLVTSTDTGAWGADFAFVATSRDIIENTRVTINPQFVGPFFPSVGT